MNRTIPVNCNIAPFFYVNSKGFHSIYRNVQGQICQVIPTVKSRFKGKSELD